MACCPHPVERHAYNGCASCGCSVTWSEHPQRDLDTTPEAHDARIAELERLRKTVCAKDVRIAELGATVLKVSRETPYPDEIRDWVAQRGKLVAELGTLRAEVADLKRSDKFLRYFEIHDDAIKLLTKELTDDEAVRTPERWRALADDAAANIWQLIRERDEARAVIATLNGMPG